MCEMKQEGQFSKNNNLLLYAIQLVSVMKWNKRGSFQKNPINDNMLLNLGAKWKKRGSFQKTTIYYCMLFNLFAYWNETRRTVFKNKTKNTNLLQYVIQLVCILKWNKMVSFQKNPINDNMLLNLCAKWNKRGSFQKTTIYYSMLFNKRGIFQKTTIYYCMIFNLCAYWNETRGTVFKKKSQQFITVCYSTRGAFFKKQQFITVWYSTCVRIEMKQDGQLSKKSNWWQYATELVREMKQEGQFSKTNNLLLYAIQLVCVLKWNKRDSFQKQNKKHQFITVCYSTRGAVLKNNNLLLYDIQLVCILKWNKRDSFQQQKKTQIYYSMLFNLCAYWNETRGAVFKNQQFITVCYSTCVRIEMKQEG